MAIPVLVSNHASSCLLLYIAMSYVLDAQYNGYKINNHIIKKCACIAHCIEHCKVLHILSFYYINQPLHIYIAMYMFPQISMNVKHLMVVVTIFVLTLTAVTNVLAVMDTLLQRATHIVLVCSTMSLLIP